MEFPFPRLGGASTGGAVGLIVLGFVAGVVSNSSDSNASTETVRWGNIGIQVSKDSNVSVSRQFMHDGIELAASGSQVLVLISGGSRVVVDAGTGALLEQSILPEDAGAMQTAISTLTITSEGSGTLWPYACDAPKPPGGEFGPIAAVPDPRTGIRVSFGLNDEFSPNPVGPRWTVSATNGRSTMSINAETGTVITETTAVHPEDSAAFQCLLSR